MSPQQRKRYETICEQTKFEEEQRNRTPYKKLTEKQMRLPNGN